MTESAAELLPLTTRVIQQGITEHLHSGVQLYVSQNFQTVADLAVGEDRPGIPLSTETILPWLSAGKPLTAALILQRMDAGKLSLDEPVAHLLPEFAAAGKEQITLKDLLTHQAGLKPIATGWPKRSWSDIVEKICRTGIRRDRGEGSRIGYDPARSWFILGEILQKIDDRQRSIDQIMREDLLEPLGMWDSWMAIPESRRNDILPRLGSVWNTQHHQLTPLPMNTEEYCRTPSPGGSLRGPIRELARFYEMLLRGGTTQQGQRLLKTETVTAMILRQREGEFDVTFQHRVDFGLGIIINSNRYGPETVPYGFGRFASEEAFGHGGAQSSIGFADPKYNLVVTAVANGHPGEEIHNQRFRELNSALYQDLGLAKA